MDERISSLKKEWQDLAKKNYQEAIAHATEQFKRLLAARDLGFLEFDSSNANKKEYDDAEFEDSSSMAGSVANSQASYELVKETEQFDHMSIVSEEK